jgi:hypothetical protein
MKAMQVNVTETRAMSNYVIVEVSCRVCGSQRTRLAADGWSEARSCPRCRRRCNYVYLGHGFSNESSHAATTELAQVQ